MIEGLLYEPTVSQGNTIKEVFIPSCKIAFNSMDCIFECDSPRNKYRAKIDNPVERYGYLINPNGKEQDRPTTKVELEESFVEKLKAFVKARAEYREMEKAVMALPREYFK
jgi:hypothetical protein